MQQRNNLDEQADQQAQQLFTYDSKTIHGGQSAGLTLEQEDGHGNAADSEETDEPALPGAERGKCQQYPCVSP